LQTTEPPLAGKTHGQVIKVEVDPVAPNPGENITITAHVKLDKATTKISSDLVFAAVDHNKFDGCAGATIKAPLGIATVVMPPAGCPLVPGDDIVFKRYVRPARFELAIS
jgi:hypothetical protein